MKLSFNPNDLWQSFSATFLAGADGLGAYLDESALTLVHVGKGLKGLQVQHLIRLERQGEDEALATRLKEAVVQWGLEGCPVSLAVSRDLGFLRPAALPQAAAENLAQVVGYELDRFLPLPAERLYYDYQVLGETDSEIRIMLMALPREAVDGCLDLLSQAGLRPIALELGPYAAATAFSQLAAKLPPSWLLLHLEPGTFELAHLQGQAIRAFRQGRIASGADLNRLLSEEIERLKAAGHQFKAMCLHGQSGSGFQATALSESQNLNLVYPSHLAIQNLPPETEQDGTLAAVGGALRSLGKVSVGGNLLPVSERAAVHLARINFNTLMLLVFLSFCCLWAGSVFIHKRVVLYQVNSQLARLEPEARAVERQLEESRALAKQMENFRKMGSTPEKLRILKDLTELIPDNTWLFNVRLSRQNLDISGISKSASDLIPLLEKSGWLTKTEFASPIVTDATKQEHFKIKADFK
ncbi:MAG: PilN domain-containing protein [Deltaproteobacteria bacterium]|nr:PilN domain-containing protein [Deltaproteobacteria bacterium]